VTWERWAGAAGVAFVVLYIVAFSLGIEVGPTDREIRAHYADSGNRRNEAVAFFLIAAADLALLVFAIGIRNRIASAEPEPRPLAALAWASAIAAAALLLAGNAVSRATAFAALSADFVARPERAPPGRGRRTAPPRERCERRDAPRDRELDRRIPARRPAALARLGGLPGGAALPARGRVRRLPRARAVGARGVGRARPRAPAGARRRP
jgi:hypothetical protein